MGQHKMEKEFSKKLNQREIIPSANSWDRLDAMLTVAEQGKTKRDFGWLYIAAAILGFLFLATLYFREIPEVKDVPRNNVLLEDQSHKPSHEKQISIPNTQDAAIATAPKPKSTIKTPVHQESNPVQINEAPQPRQIIAQNPTLEKPSSLIINQKTVQPINLKVDAPIVLSDAGPKSAGTQTSIKVDSKSLLSQVDGEVNLTFREKMLRKIGKNYKEVAEAVSNRNIQQ